MKYVIAAGIVLALAIINGSFGDAEDAEITAKFEAEARDRKAVTPCQLTIAQFGPGERWYQHQHVYECASAARELPAHILSWPLMEAQ